MSDTRRSHRNGLLTILALLVISLTTLADIAGAAPITIPDVIGKSEDEARAVLEAAGVTGKISAQRAEKSDCSAVDVVTRRVCGQSPSAGSKQPAILDIWLFIQGEKLIPILRLPERVLRNTPDWGRTHLAKLGFTSAVKVVSSSQAGFECAQNIPSAELGQVCNLLPQDHREVPANTLLTFVVQGPRTLGDPYEYLPDLRGVTLERSLNQLNEAGFREFQFRFREPRACRDRDPGTVCSVNGGDVKKLALRKSRVRLDVATEYPGTVVPDTARTPDLSKNALSVAREKLDAIGFRSPIIIRRDRSCEIPEEDGLEPGQVCGQSSAPGSSLSARSPLSLTVYERRDRGGYDIGKPWIRMPDVRGKTREEAESILEEIGFEGVVFEDREEPGCPPSTVCASDPPAGRRAFLSTEQLVYLGPVPPPPPPETDPNAIGAEGSDSEAPTESIENQDGAVSEPWPDFDGSDQSEEADLQDDIDAFFN